MEWWQILGAIVLAVVIWKVGIAMIRSVVAGAPPAEKPEIEDVENLEVSLVCRECGTEYRVTRLGEVQIPRHCGEPMSVVRRPAAGAP